MALREIRVEGDPILSKKCKDVKEVTPRIKALIDDMFETMDNAQGVGLAAPQVGILKRIVTIGIDAEEEGEEDIRLVLINPKIVSREGEQRDYEGCLSVPGVSGIVTRPEKVVCEAYDENMELGTIEAEGLLARCICHELDHLDGHLYTEIVEGDLVSNEELRKQEEEEA